MDAVLTRSKPALEHYERMRVMPQRLPIMYHHWRDLLFLHFAAEPEQIQKLVPKGLTVDTFPDASGVPRAWIGVVAFRMFGIRPRWMPPLPFLSAFPETNVRTYVHQNGEEPGVLFLSMDARPKLACQIARMWYREPYTQARMFCRRDGDRVTYASDRVEGIPAKSRIVAQVGDISGPSQPGTLDYFLVERYQLYTGNDERLYKARVWHEPYRRREVELLHCEMDLLEPLGIEPQPWTHKCFCDAADTKIYPLQRCN